MSTIDFYKATLNDIQLLVDSRVEFLTEYWGSQGKQAELKLRAELQNYFEQSIRNESYQCWLAKMDDELAGVGGMVIMQRPGSFRVPDGRSAYIMNMYTTPRYRRMGIATQILKKLIESGRQMGITFFELHATKEGEPVYIKDGFQLHKEPTYRKFLTDLST